MNGTIVLILRLKNHGDYLINFPLLSRFFPWYHKIHYIRNPKSNNLILVDQDIKKALGNGTISIVPYNRNRLGSNSYDLTLGNTLVVYTEKVLDCKIDNPHKSILIPDEGYVLKPGELYLGFVNEYTGCDKTLVPCIEGKSSIARLGISVHLTAGFGDCAWKGCFTLEVTCVKPVRIYADMPIAQIYWTMTLGSCEVPYSMKRDAKYQNQPAKAITSKMFLNFHKNTEVVSIPQQ